jgi:hypothetical protein
MQRQRNGLIKVEKYKSYKKKKQNKKKRDVTVEL